MNFQIDLQKTTALLQQGNMKSALKLAKTAMKRHRDQPVFANLAAVALSAMGKHREAVPLFQKALSMDPNYYDARRNLGAALISVGFLDKAERVLSKATALQPTDGQSWLYLATALHKLGKLRRACDAITQAQSFLPASAALALEHAEILTNLGEIHQAQDLLQKARKLDPGNLAVLYKIASLMIYQFRQDEALTVLEQALQLAPQNASTLEKIASLKLSQGESSEARKILHQILVQDPANHGALERLAGFAAPEEAEKLDKMATEALGTAPKKSLQHASLLFARAHLARRQHDTSAAQELYRQANKETAALVSYQPKVEEELNRSIVKGYAALPKEIPQVASVPAPIYVIGLPRSGTTLTEAILAAHPQVAALGERNVDETLASGYLNGHSFGPEDCANLARVTSSNLPRLAETPTAYVDKMPENHRFIGFLVATQPDAKVIHLKRDPRDIALSQWQVLFAGGALPYTYDFKAMAHRFNLYAQMMNFWHSALPGRILDMRYEDLVSNIEAGSKRLATHCALDWHPQMASHHASVGVVQTASQHQIRQPVHTRSIQKWHGQEALLEPFVKALDPELWPEICKE